MIQIRDSVVLGIFVQNVVVEHLHIVPFVVLRFVKVNNFVIYLFSLYIIAFTLKLIIIIDSTPEWKPI